MKIVIIVGIGVIILALCVLIIGLLLPKQHAVSRSASFHASPEQLYSLIGGPQTWRPDVVRCEAVPDAAGRELISETTRNGETITYQVLDRKPFTSITRRIATENLPYSGTWTFSIQPGTGATLVRITERGEVRNPIFRFVSRFVLGQTHAIDAYLNELGKTTAHQTGTKH